MKKFFKFAYLFTALTISISLIYLVTNLNSLQKDVEEFEILTADGKPLLATGNCTNDGDCFPSGCSGNICSNHEVTTTCESSQFPEKDSYKCGCINQRCVWFRPF